MASKAVLCGINNYKTQSDLRGCINDVNNMYQLLTQVFRFEPSQIHKFTDNEVTKTVIKNEWIWLVKDARPGDYLMFHFSGHGSYVPDDNDDEGNPYDEITCLYDMDFNNPKTFLRDDEWDKMIQQIPQGVQMTVIMDNCHSGTGTRKLSFKKQGLPQSIAVDFKTSSNQGQANAGRYPNRKNAPLWDNLETQTATLEVLDEEKYEELLKDPKIVLPRFLEPPYEMKERVIAAARMRGMKPKRAETLNHILLAACQDDQTAADAYIEGDYNGAFTYYLCEALRQSPQLKSQQLIESVARALRTNQFEQKPQHEGNSSSGLIFGIPIVTDSLFRADVKPLLPTKSSHGLDTQTQQLLIQAYMKLLDTLAGSAETKDAIVRRTGNSHLVYVHGISQHRSGYSNGWWNALKQHVGEIFGDGNLNTNRWEVIWSDLVNARASFNEVEKEQLRREIMTVLEERRQSSVAANTGGGRDARRAIIQSRNAERGSGFAIDDFLTYMLDSNIRQQIIDRFTKVVEPLLRSNNQIDIVAHSWGTVVAYEGLCELEKNTSLPGRVKNFFTVGSALSILPVRAHLRNANKNGHCPANVERWINLDAKGDLVGGMLSDKFDITHESLELEPTSCPKEFFGYSLSCAHSSYFHESNITVNRNIFAKFMTSEESDRRVRSSSQSSSGSYFGNNGNRIYEGKHTDIDESTLDISCRTGSCRVTLEEAIWSDWANRLDRSLTAEGRINETIEVDSSVFDADHKLIVIATADGTTVDINWESKDR
ncbi:caspase family protein [Nostoc punctiforme FACHB-252]|uniref:Caspase family protein n=2 Tax=Nostoc punctiforme TaxID=272131 RepID=A0ABR8HLW9_NOSPU|nr:caspase family protein [Nostoc punctiforme FACHB-252]